MTTLKMKVDGAWIPVGGTPETVWTGPSAPTNPEIDLWVDTDEAALQGPITLTHPSQIIGTDAGGATKIIFHLATDNIIYVGSSSHTTRVLGSSVTIPGNIINHGVARALGYVGATGTENGNGLHYHYGMVSSVRTALGQYRLTWTTALNNFPFFICTPVWNDGIIQVRDWTPTQATVYTRLSTTGAASDMHFMFAAFGL